ncbi:MAG TPA: SMC family ATPase [Gemmataceae bacterium]|nr:SMC family ATPase [Gemmataceae bacterium]
MIPLAIELEGFLSFREKHRLQFPSNQITLLCGENGSGKSSVFDGILLSLFGGCRLGGEPSVHLINKTSDLAKVALEFQSGDDRFRVERTLARKDGTYEQTAQLKSWNEKKNDWAPVKQAAKIGDCNRRLKEILGISYEGFTTSVLLLQGKAETLLNQDSPTAQTRFKAIAAIVGLDFYAELHKRADKRRLELDKEAGKAKAALGQIDDVTPEQIDAANQNIQKAEEAAQEAAKSVAGLEQLKKQAEEHKRLSTDLDKAILQREEQDRLFKDKEAIKRDAERLRELDLVLPLLKNILEQRAEQKRAQGEIAKLELKQQELSAEGEQRATSLHELKNQLAEQQNQLTATVSQREETDRHKQDLTLALSPLKRVHDQRKNWLETMATLQPLADALAGHERDEAAKAQAIPPLECALTEAENQFHQAQKAVTQAETKCNETREKQNRFNSVAGGGVCSWCGQKLSAEHAIKERQNLAEELQQRQADFEEADRERARWEVEKKKAKLALDQARKDHQLAREAAQRARTQREQALEKAKTAQVALEEAFQELEPAWQNRIGRLASNDWNQTQYPDAADLSQLRQEQEGAEKLLLHLRNKESSLQGEVKRLQKETGELEKAANDAQKNQQSIAQSVTAERTKSETAQQQEQNYRNLLPIPWRVQADAANQADFDNWTQELTALKRSRADARAQALAQALGSRKTLEDSITEYERQIAAIPELCRREPADVEEELVEARKKEREQRDAVVEHRKDRESLLAQQQQRATLADKSRQSDHQHAVAEKLAGLLSEKNLQRHLIRQAEVAIVGHANRVLDRLSAGMLRIRLLETEETAKLKGALHFVVEKSDGNEYAIISGSEGFRVAISLALGIGQFASRLHCPIETVIIDEGFGCLDAKNRETMMEEIDLLRGELKCILLVSHLEEFAQRFPYGYRFALEDGTTQVTLKSA